MAAVALLLTVGFCCVDIYPLGPVHDQFVAPFPPLSKVKSFPTHTGLGSADAVMDEGIVITVTGTVVTDAAVPQALLAVNV